MKHTQTFLMLVLLLITALPLHADEEWKARAYVHAAKPGITEAVLPPELFMEVETMRGRDRIDLALAGPDGNQRSFELFWREPPLTVRFGLKPERMELTDSGEFIWEGNAPKPEIESLHVTIRDTNFVGQVDVEAKKDNAWVVLAKNAALFRSGGQTRAEIAIAAGQYTKIRLRFRSFDQAFKMKVLPVDRVTASGKTAGRNYVKETIAPEFQTAESGEVTEIRTLLPGSGLFIDSVHLVTETQFQGHWQIGRETIINGERTFVPIKKGSISTVSAEGNELTFAISHKWQGKSLVIKLDPQGRYLGTPKDFTVGLFLPRLIFSADKPGKYIALAGTGEKAKILPNPGSNTRKIAQALLFSKPEFNPNLTELALTDKYRLRGGPFNSDGFTWTAAVVIDTPGYYRLPFPMEASLAPNRTGIRLAKEKSQIPFFMDRTENVDVSLPLTPEYEESLNQTTWDLTLPQASPWWVSLNLTTTGIFKRTVTIQRPKPGQMGWETWATKSWQNTRDDKTTLKIPLTRLPKEQSQLRIVINHNDNQPLTINAIDAVYSAPAICFLAHDPGTLTLHGGHPTLPPPTYDLSLVQTKLLETLPTPIQAQPITSVTTPFWSGIWIKHFRGKGWGLYAALGLVAVVLLGIIAKMLPAPEKE
ncbi:hypothetical protein DSLASN_04440 [Desulfoluna limicola]|uniref:Uncharacterized protein n=1 Tax=Desulfoluna limicola TaxID=2810562 RepID=A0ABM7PB72_9BACT|nr:hypothetical protein [Desulfoluna limicola]BCS94812.1 hypothetical protein DSLASN_04440 [Desulfoluna limicola]